MSPLISKSPTHTPAQRDLKAPATGSLRSTLYGAAPAVLTLALMYGLRNTPLPQPLAAPGDRLTPGQAAANSRISALLPVSATMIIAPDQAAGYHPLEGKLQPAVRVIGKAPTTGQVSRVLVAPGQQVNVGDKVMQLSMGPTSLAPTAADHRQSVAEAAQVAAANQQDALQQKIQQTQARLHEAQFRVNAAQRRVAEARELVAQLKHDNATESAAGATAPANAAHGASTAHSATPSHEDRLNQQRYSAAVREADQAGKEATAAGDKLHAAERAEARATEALKTSQEKLKAATANADHVQEQFDDNKAKGSDVEKARSTLADAKGAVEEATTRLETARKEVKEKQADESDARANAKGATARVADLMRHVKVFDQDSDATPTSSATPVHSEHHATNHVSIAEAAQIVRSAVEESDAAVRNAERIKNQLDGYSRQVNNNAHRLDTTSQNLATAQERVMEDTIRRGLSNVRAPATGTVTWVAELAQEVSEGDPLIRIGQPDELEARLEDHTDTWKHLQPGMVLHALVQTTAPMPNVAPQMTAAAALGSHKLLAQPTVLVPAQTPNVTPVQVRLREVQAPAKPGEPAVLVITVYNPPLTNALGQHQLHPGLTISCSVGDVAQGHEVNIPVSAIRRDATGSNVVAVLKPADDTSLQGPYQIDWRSVSLGPVVGAEQKVVSGLLPGERIALQPDKLYDLTATYGPQATVRLQIT
jgi:hypothetical protein